MKVRTSELQSALNKVVKGAGNNRFLPLTSMIKLAVSNDMLNLTTTDGTNYTTVHVPVEEPTDFYAVVNVDIFNKLVSKLSTALVDLTVTAKSLNIVARGTFDLGLQFDETGKIIKFPEFTLTDEHNEIAELEPTTVSAIIKANSGALANMSFPIYTNYYVSDSVISTDTMIICNLDKKIFAEPKLISASLMQILTIFDKSFRVFEDNASLVFCNDDTTVYSKKTTDSIKEYAIASVKNLLAEEFNNVCELDRDVLAKILDRISLFINAYDNNAIKLLFESDKLTLSSVDGSGEESIEYTSSSIVDTAEVWIDSELFKTAINSAPSSKLTIKYNASPTLIGVESETLTEVVALMNK